MCACVRERESCSVIGSKARERERELKDDQKAKKKVSEVSS